MTNFYLGSGDGKIAFHNENGTHFTLGQLKSGRCFVRVAATNPSIEEEDLAIDMALNVSKCTNLVEACDLLGIGGGSRIA